MLTADSVTMNRFAMWLICASIWATSAHNATWADSAATTTFDQLVAAADAALQLGELQIAESRLREALVEGWLLRGGIAVADGDLKGAAEAYRQGSVSAVETRRSLTSLGLVQLQAGQIDEGIDTLRDVSLRNPADGQTRRFLAQALVTAGRTKEAVLELEEGYAADSEPETAFALATGYLRQGRVEAADELYQRVIEARPQPQTRVLIGRSYRDFKYFERAQNEFESALAADPSLPRVHYYLGTMALLELGVAQLDRAIEYFRAELELAPADPMTHLYLGMALVEDRQFALGLEPLKFAVGWPPAEMDARRYLGEALLALDRPAEAAEFLEPATRVAADLAARGGGGIGKLDGHKMSGIHYQLGLALRRSGRADEAAEHFAVAQSFASEMVDEHRERYDRFQRDEDEPLDARVSWAPSLDTSALARLNPADRDALRRQVVATLASCYSNLGVMEARAERYGRAAPLLQQAVELAPDNTDWQRALGMANFRAGRFADATSPLSIALERRPRDDEARRVLALAWLNLERYEATIDLLANDDSLPSSLLFAHGLALVRVGRASEAAPIFDQLLATGEAWPAVHVLLGQAHAQAGDFAAAIETLRHALELDGRVAEAHATLGDIFMRQGKLIEAAAELRAELDISPSDLRARFHLALVLELDRQPEEAKKHLQTVLRNEPKHADARYLMGKILLADGDPESAIEQLKAALADSPEDVNIHYQLGQAYQRSGRKEQAEQQFAAFRELKARQRKVP